MTLTGMLDADKSLKTPFQTEDSEAALAYLCRTAEIPVANNSALEISAIIRAAPLEAEPIQEIAPKTWQGTANGTHWQLLQGDASVCLKTLPANSFNCVVTSPPYYWLRDYGVEQQIGQEETVAEYVEAIASVMDEVYRVLKQNGVLFCGYIATELQKQRSPCF